MEKDRVVTILNRLLETALAGVARYTHSSLMVFGFGRIPAMSWLREQGLNCRASAVIRCRRHAK